jgi:galactokinase
VRGAQGPDAMREPPLAAAPMQRARAAFEAAWRAEPQIGVLAPGRVNLIGEHTDYNDGFVLPCAIGYATAIAAAPRSDQRVRVVAADCAGAQDEFLLDAAITPRADAPWANYVRGMVQSLLADGLALQGADLAIAGNVPQGAGLSSSASLEVAVGQAFKTLFSLHGLTPTRMAQLAQRAENSFIGVACGIMDQLVCTLGQRGHALLIDCRSLQTMPVPLPADAALMIVHSGVERGLVGSQYNARRRQCEAAARHWHVAALRDVDEALLAAGAAGLDAVVLRRARHVVSENRRTQQAAVALAAGDLHMLGRLMAESHVSMRDDFEITVAPIDQLVALAQDAIGAEGGARMTGGGFGGCVVAVMPHARVVQVQSAIAREYRTPSGEAAMVWVTQAAAGAGSA